MGLGFRLFATSGPFGTLEPHWNHHRSPNTPVAMLAGHSCFAAELRTYLDGQFVAFLVSHVTVECKVEHQRC